MFKSRRATTAWHLLFNYLSIGLMIVQGVVLVPLYLKHIPVETYGYWMALGNVVAWLTILDPGVGNLIQQKVGEASGTADWAAIHYYAKRGLVLSAAFAGFLLLAGWITAPAATRWVGCTGPEAGTLIDALRISVLSSAVMLFAYALGGIVVGLQGTFAQGVISFGTTVISIVATVWLLQWGAGVLAIAVALLLRAILWSLGSLIYLFFRLRKHRPSGATVRSYGGFWRMSTIAFFDKTVAAIATNIDSFALARWATPETVASLNLSRRPVELCVNLVSRPSAALMPALAQLKGAGDLERARSILIRFVQLCIWVCGAAAVGLLTFNRSFVELWVGATLYVGGVANAGLVLGFMIGVIVLTLTNLCWALDDVVATSRISLVQNVTIMVLFIPAIKYGQVLAAILLPAAVRLFIGIPWLVTRFTRAIRLSAAEARMLLAETSKVVGVAIVCALVARLFGGPRTSWLAFGSAAGIFCAAYAILLSAVSRQFRIHVLRFHR